MCKAWSDAQADAARNAAILATIYNCSFSVGKVTFLMEFFLDQLAGFSEFSYGKFLYFAVLCVKVLNNWRCIKGYSTIQKGNPSWRIFWIFRISIQLVLLYRFLFYDY